jgi:hypothetical protein
MKADSTLNNVSSVVGHVTVSLDRSTFKGLNVYLVGRSTVNTITDTSGYYEFRELIPGQYLLKFSGVGCATYDTSGVELKDGQRYIIDVNLGAAILEIE